MAEMGEWGERTEANEAETAAKHHFRCQFTASDACHWCKDNGTFDA
jgi:hypothetical protein